MFFDKVKIVCKAGNGGNGCVSFFRDARNPSGGPDGGDGGNGGNVVFKVSNNLTNLVDFRFKKKFWARNGQDGSKKLQTGKSGEDIVILVPQGTVIRNVATGKVVADMFYANQEVVLLKGGKGGRGNKHFCTPTRQAPRFSEMGITTKEFELLLELKTIADVGLIGFPNVGKSTILSCVSNARPKIANYHFTTLAPNIGVVKAYDTSFVMADIPGLIEGASDGLGLGLDFLKHIERTRLLLHVVDISGSEGRDPFEDYQIINGELNKYSDDVKNLPQIVVLNKIDLLGDDKEQVIADFKKRLGKGVDVFTLSAVSYQGFDELLKCIVERLSKIAKREPVAIEELDMDKRNKKEYKIIRHAEHYFELVGELIDTIAYGVMIDDMSSFAYFQKRLKDEGIIDNLKELGMEVGDTVKVCDIEFEYIE